MTAHHDLVVPMKAVRTGASCEECDVDFFVTARFGIESDSPSYKDANWLFNTYVRQKQTMAEISNQFGVTPMTIQYWLDKHNIPTRPRGRQVKE